MRSLNREKRTQTCRLLVLGHILFQLRLVCSRQALNLGLMCLCNRQASKQELNNNERDQNENMRLRKMNTNLSPACAWPHSLPTAPCSQPSSVESRLDVPLQSTSKQMRVEQRQQNGQTDLLAEPLRLVLGPAEQ